MSLLFHQSKNRANQLSDFYRAVQKAAVTWPFIVVAFAAFVYGPRYTYLISDFMTVGLGIIFGICVGRRYWRVE